MDIAYTPLVYPVVGRLLMDASSRMYELGARCCIPSISCRMKHVFEKVLHPGVHVFYYRGLRCDLLMGATRTSSCSAVIRVTS